jgi:hypothetical protein
MAVFRTSARFCIHDSAGINETSTEFIPDSIGPLTDHRGKVFGKGEEPKGLFWRNSVAGEG